MGAHTQRPLLAHKRCCGHHKEDVLLQNRLEGHSSTRPSPKGKIHVSCAQCTGEMETHKEVHDTELLRRWALSVGTQGALVPLQWHRQNTSTAMAAGSCTSDPGNCASCPRRSQRRQRCLHKEVAQAGAPCNLPTSVRAASQVLEGSEKAKRDTGVRRRTYIAVWPAPAIRAQCWERWLLAHAIRGARRCLPVPIALCVQRRVSACQAGSRYFQERASQFVFLS